jgi:hypothetical protein
LAYNPHPWAKRVAAAKRYADGRFVVALLRQPDVQGVARRLVAHYNRASR